MPDWLKDEDYAFPVEGQATRTETSSMFTPPTLLTVGQFSAKHPAFTEQSLRWLIFQAKPRQSSRGLIEPNGLEEAILRIGRKVLIDEARFFDWVSNQQTGQ